ncbi:PHP domain-containing protein [Clostridium thermarum]|uniref:PHP domain-containing protein n=1 Tax=Clostridium thermarum TaxID=1716543 RepID=UPI0013D04F56|nr:PHP domain-containing protein [Clostridium thermarum]
MSTKADLHLHTTASDGKLSPKELVNLAHSVGINIMAVTDHDTTSGVEEALAASVSLPLDVIPGIELSTQHKGETVHILGYFRDDSYKAPKFQGKLQEMKDHRLWRGKKIVENLKQYFDIVLDYEALLEDAKGVIARPHIARAIINAGYNYDWQYIFDQLIGKNSPAYVPNKKLSSEDGIKLLKSVNALVVLAHPILVKKTPCEDLINLDFDGIEAVYWQNTPKDTDYFINLSLEHNKFITGGSDFHGGDAGDSKHGYIGSVEYDEKYLLNFRKNFYKK